jgi:signal transduction histidine kinase
LRIGQVVTNLLSNAIKYGAGKPVDLAVSGDDASARISVTDRGIGVPEEQVGRIFGVFERAAPVQHYGGLGLGLYVVREVVEAHGGRVEVQTRAGKGSTFVVTLPRVTPTARPTETEASEEDVAREPSDSSGSAGAGA